MSEAESEQWQAFDRRMREPAEFVRALVEGGLARVDTEEGGDV
jgi:hypothetical protein